MAKREALWIVYIAVLSVLVSGSASAYTGGFSIFPALVGGPDSTTISNFDLDTESENPYTIEADMGFVQTVIIETDPAIDSHILIKEEPAKKDSPAIFSFIVPGTVQDALVEATVYFWGPDVDELEILHEHNGAEPELIDAERSSPEEYDEDGRVLWYFTTTSFSDFTIINPLSEKNRRDHSKEIVIVLVYAIFLALLSASACLLLGGRKG